MLLADKGKAMIAQPRLLCRYHYDPLDRIAGLATTSDAETRLFYQKSRLATQIQAGMQHSILQVDDHLLAQTSHSGKAAETALLAADGLRSVVHVVGSGQHQAQAYTAYGYQRPTSGLHSLLGFAGEQPDPVTGHYLLGNGYRAFNPVLMRFNSPDSVSPFGEGGVNAYAYCLGDPVNFRDPLGSTRFPLPNLMRPALGKGNKSVLNSIARPNAVANKNRLKLEDVLDEFLHNEQGLKRDFPLSDVAMPSMANADAMADVKISPADLKVMSNRRGNIMRNNRLYAGVPERYYDATKSYYALKAYAADVRKLDKAKPYSGRVLEAEVGVIEYEKNFITRYGELPPWPPVDREGLSEKLVRLTRGQ